jgi:N utilization substance protein A
MRVQSIIRELRGEKIDIIEFSDDPVVFATHALSPAKVSRITILDLLEKHMEVIVDDSQLSLAIGKKGQNVRLAAKLLGWKIDIKSEEEKRQEVESAMAALVGPGAPVSSLIDFGLAEKVVEKLVEAGVGTIDRLGGMTPEQLEEIQGIGDDMVEQIQVAVNGYYGQFEEPGQAVQEEAPADLAELEGSAPDLATVPEELAEVEGADAASLDTETLFDPGEPVEPGTPEAEAEQFGRIEDAGSPTHNSEGAEPESGPESTREKDSGE